MVINNQIVYSNISCKCGCGGFSKQGKDYIHGHSRKGKKRTKEQNRKIAETRIKNGVAVGKNNPSYKHGESKTRLYKIWIGMKSRCFNFNKLRYKDYGGRGVTLCPEWTNDYIAFRDWALSNGYQEGLGIDRRDNDGNYNPKNCRWLTIEENNRNTRNVKLDVRKVKEIRIKYKSKKYTQQQLAIEYNVSQVLISVIVTNRGWKNIDNFSL